MAEQTKGWLVPVWTKRLGNSETLAVYAAALKDPNDAVDAVKIVAQFVVGTDRIGPATPMLDGTYEALRLSPKQVSML
jgi:hypothetical protein